MTVLEPVMRSMTLASLLAALLSLLTVLLLP